MKNENNAIVKAQMQNYQRILKEYPHSKLMTSGLDVGLPEGQIGNSEVGLLLLVQGVLFIKIYPCINNAISSGDF